MIKVFTNLLLFIVFSACNSTTQEPLHSSLSSKPESKPISDLILPELPPASAGNLSPEPPVASTIVLPKQSFTSATSTTIAEEFPKEQPQATNNNKGTASTDGWDLIEDSINSLGKGFQPIPIQTEKNFRDNLEQLSHDEELLREGLLREEKLSRDEKLLREGLLHGEHVLYKMLLHEEKLSRRKMRLDKDTSGNTALIRASIDGDTNRVQTLLNEFPKEQLLSKNKQGDTALMWASSMGHTNTVKELLKYFPEEQLLLKNNAGSIALMHASYRGHDVIRELLQHIPKEQLEATNKRGFTALKIAQLYDNKNAISIIERILDESHER